MIAHYLPRYLAALCIAVWVGGMLVLGYVVVPTLFRILPDRQLAGMAAGQLFTLMAYVGIVCALYLLFHQLRVYGRSAMHRATFGIVGAMLLLVLAGQFVLQPILVDIKARALPLDVMHSVLASRFTAWHAVSGIFYLIQSLLGTALVLVSSRD